MNFHHTLSGNTHPRVSRVVSKEMVSETKLCPQCGIDRYFDVIQERIHDESQSNQVILSTHWRCSMCGFVIEGNDMRNANCANHGMDHGMGGNAIASQQGCPYKPSSRCPGAPVSYPTVYPTPLEVSSGSIQLLQEDCHAFEGDGHYIGDADPDPHPYPLMTSLETGGGMAMAMPGHDLGGPSPPPHFVNNTDLISNAHNISPSTSGTDYFTGGGGVPVFDQLVLPSEQKELITQSRLSKQRLSKQGKRSSKQSKSKELELSSGTALASTDLDSSKGLLGLGLVGSQHDLGVGSGDTGPGEGSILYEDSDESESESRSGGDLQDSIKSVMGDQDEDGNGEDTRSDTASCWTTYQLLDEDAQAKARINSKLVKVPSKARHSRDEGDMVM